MGFIFSTSSYAFALGLERQSISELSSQYAKLGIRLESYGDLAELLPALERTRYLIAIHTPESLSIESRIALRRWAFALVETPQVSKNLVGPILEGLVPDGLDRLAEHALSKVYPIFFDCLPMGLQLCNEPANFDCDVAIQCDTSAWPQVGRCLLMFNQMKFQQIAGMAFFERSSRRNLIDLLREFVNQFLGVINQTLTNMGFNCRIGLPLVFNRQDAQAFLKTGLYVPSIHFCDDYGIFNLKLGMINSTAGPKLDLSGTELVDTSGDIDFL